ncbi:MAG: TetR/AcrR family transcriptional regulator [Pirellulales bacterium]
MSIELEQELNPTIRRNPERTRRLLLEAAVKLFAQKGRDGTSVDEICQASGVNCRMIYHYYGNKDGLYMAMLAHVYGRIREIVVKPEKKSQTLTEFIETLTERYFRFLQANPEFVAVLRWENATGAEGIRALDLNDFRSVYFEEAAKALGEQEVLKSSRNHSSNDYSTTDSSSTDKGMLIILTCCSLCGYYFSNQASMSNAFGFDIANPEFAEKWLTHIKQVAVASFQ